MPNTAGTRRSQAREGVFISYARSDGEAYAARLRARLEAERVPLWQDRVGMEGGRDWWLQITEALGRVEFMVLVVTPNALRSDTVRKEWRHARQQGVCVYPVQGARDLDFATLPGWMRDAHFYDLGPLEGGAAGPEWTKFLNDLRTRCRTPRVPFMVEDLPEDFVMRPDEFERVLSLLLDAERGEPVAITAALRGAGGYGKTTLARALCHDERVQDAFDDGVLWVTLGETPGDLTGRVEDLIFTLSDERPGFTGIDAATAHFAELLADRDILIVIDDVWNEAHLKPFVQGGQRCARLITTRNADTLPANAKTVNVDAMRQGEAVALLSAALPGELPAALGGALRRLAARLGDWPLLLKLVNGALRARVRDASQPPHDAIAYVEKALDTRGLTFFDARNPVAREQAVSKTLGVSLGFLSGEERERYGELAVFPEDVDVPLPTLEKFWGATGGLDEFEVETLCERLNRLSLLLRLDLATRQVRLHDVIRAYLLHEQGAKLPALHRRLLDAHRPPASPPPAASPWAHMPAREPYFWDHLASHLIDAGLDGELISAVKDLAYLAAKTLARKSVAVEADLLAAERRSPAEPELRLLRRSYAQASHLFNRCETQDELEATLLSRLQHLGALSEITGRFAPRLKRPHLTPLHPLPDLPHPALVRIWGGHRGIIGGCAVSRDGALIVSASWDKTVRVWDAKNGRERLRLEGHAGYVYCCALAPDDSFIVSGSYDGTLRVWDAKGGPELMRLKGHARGVSGCAVSPDGAFIVSASLDGTLKVWGVAGGEEWLTLAGHESDVRGCAVSPDGAFIASASDDGTVRLWDARSGQEQLTLRGHSDHVRGCAVSPDGDFIASASDDGTVKVWDARSGRELLALIGHKGRVRACAVSPDSASVISASDDGTVRVWDAKSGGERARLAGHRGGASCCAASPDGAFIVSASGHGMLKVWSAKAEGQSPARVGHAGSVRGCAVSEDGSTVVTCSGDKTLLVWNAQTGSARLRLRGHRGGVNDCDLSRDGAHVVSASYDGTLRVWDAKDGSRRLLLGERGGGPYDWGLTPVNNCAINPDGSLVVSISDDGTLRLWDLKSGREQLKLESQQGSRRGACSFSPDGSSVVAGGDNAITVWRVHGPGEQAAYELQQEFQRTMFYGSSVRGCDISPDGLLVAAALGDGTVRVWDMNDGDLQLRLSSHRAQVSSCAFSPDGRLIASTAENGTLKVWAVEEVRCLATFYADGSLDDCAWFADGRRLVAVGEEGVYFLRLTL